MTSKPDKERGPGQPTKYSEEIAARICAEMAEGRSMRSICQDDDMPALSTVFLWLSKHEEFSEQYARAMDMRSQAMFEDMQEIADNARLDYMETKKGLVLVKEAVMRSKLRIEARQWMLQRMAPKKYGDKMQVETRQDITHHYTDDDTAILERYAQRHANKKSRKPQPQGDNDAT